MITTDRPAPRVGRGICENVVSLAAQKVAARECLRTLERINQFKLYELACVVHPLVELDEDISPARMLSRLFDAREKLREYLASEPPLHLTVSLDSAKELHARVHKLIQTRFTDRKSRRLRAPALEIEPVTSSELLPIRKAAERFEAVLDADMQSCAAFVASKRGIYDTNDLVNAASRVLPQELKEFMPDKARDEVTSAGRCLAFGLYTAVGFHICRAVEAVMEVYYQWYSGKSGTLNSWHDYVEKFEQLESSGNMPSTALQTISSLAHLKQISRNPIMHPRIVLRDSDAQALFIEGIGAMCRMAPDLTHLGQ